MAGIISGRPVVASLSASFAIQSCGRARYGLLQSTADFSFGTMTGVYPYEAPSWRPYDAMLVPTGRRAAS